MLRIPSLEPQQSFTCWGSLFRRTMPGYYWTTKSMLDGSNIMLAVPTGNSKNTKTSHMSQWWVLPWDIDPWTAVKTGKDVGICGNCEHRRSINPEVPCYIDWWRAPLMIWRAVKDGRYDRWNFQLTHERFYEKSIRFGAGGDPAALPIPFYEDFMYMAGVQHRKWTGYTSQWRNPEFQWFRHLFQASVSTEEDAQIARSMGWNTYRTRKPGESLMSGEESCPGSKEANHLLQCIECCKCRGTGDLPGLTPRKHTGFNISIINH